jgi:GTP-binding protein EngB required for normal cell division
MDQFRDFIKKMIEIRNILKGADMSDVLNLPSIVVIGSQSSGKSSVLECIVGHEFLPKGQNMVTRRPLELTLINAPNCPKDYAVFTQMETGPITDFTQVQKTLTELNLAVPVDQWISSKPIELTIYSKNVPDLSLVDLPGYIQINNRNQPPVLRDKIAQLCERYIQKDNLILAVCPADVDLANAEALKASRAVDPQGLRTIGVITKLDLVDPAYSAELIRNEDYPLKLGYVGVICKPPDEAPQPKTVALLLRKGGTAISTYEESYLKSHSDVYDEVRDWVGIGSLRDRLSTALEASMSRSLCSVLSNVQDELSELRYILKVEYSDRVISPEGYVAFLASSVKAGLENVAKNYSRPRVREQLRNALHDRLLSVAEEAIWSYTQGGHINEQQLHQAVAMLTRSGVGRIAANNLVDAIVAQVKQVVKDGPLMHHPAAKERLLQQVEVTMRARSLAAIEQVENAIKPLKHELEYTDEDWNLARVKTIRFFQDRDAALSRELQSIQTEVGPRRLRRVIQQLAELESIEDTSVGMLSYHRNVVEKAREAVQLNHRLRRIRQRLEILSQPNCLHPDATPQKTGWRSWLHNSYPSIDIEEPIRKDQSITFDAGTPEAQTVHVWNGCQIRCPEIYLYLVMERLLSTSALYVHHELVHEFLHPFPDELAAGLGGALDKTEIAQFVQENPSVARHLQLQERRKILERVRDKLAYLQHLKQGE